MRKIRKAVITAAGFGSRFLPVVKTIPKEMLPVIDKPILQYVVEECINAGIEEIIIVVRKGNDVIRNYFTQEVPGVRQLLEEQGKLERYKPIEEVLGFKNIKIIEQQPELPYGNGSPVISAKAYLEGEAAFAVLFADDLFVTKEKSCIAQLIEFYEQHDEAMAVCGAEKVPYEELNRYGIIKPTAQHEDYGEFELLIEKPDADKAPSDLAIYGRFVVPFKIFEYLTAQATGKDNEVWLQDANDQLSKHGRYFYKIIDGKWWTTGDPSRFYQAFTMFMLNDPRFAGDAKAMLKKLNLGE